MDDFPVPWTSPDSNAQSAMTLQDLKLQAMSYSLRSKPSWWTKYKDETIRNKWKAEALAAPVEGDKLLEPEVDYVLDELAGYEKMRDDATGIQQSCFTRIYESDTLIPPELRDRLKEAVKVLENVPDAEKDWHPRSDGQVLDLVHPSLYPIVYGRTLRYPEGVKPEERKIEEFQPIVAPDSSITPGEDWSFSRKFAWLSTDFKITEDGSSAKAVSYINNLHPSHTELYSIIEALVARFSFLFDRVLTDLICYNESFHPRISDGYDFKDDNPDKPEQEEDEGDEEYEARVDSWNMQRPIDLPTVPSDVVGADDLSIEQDDALGVMRVYGIRRHGPANQRVGATPTPAGRCIAFPNIYQHKVSPFELADKTKPGHRKIVALFLLDPEHPRFSTTDIPPQQAEWFEVAMQQAPLTSLFRKLPAEIMKETTRQLPNLMTLEEAKQYRLTLMDERTAFVDTQDENYFASEFNFCEH
ncbi:hypothetical protein FS837_011824 [Tulasnella sp. UAMH 9824]|nr:hypothetical protein FS837_011824 [Tulasnella sp. UAMH 9824]